MTAHTYQFKVWAVQDISYNYRACGTLCYRGNISNEKWCICWCWWGHGTTGSTLFHVSFFLMNGGWSWWCSWENNWKKIWNYLWSMFDHFTVSILEEVTINNPAQWEKFTLPSSVEVSLGRAWGLRNLSKAPWGRKKRYVSISIFWYLEGMQLLSQQPMLKNIPS